MNKIEELEYKGFAIKTYYDYDAESPREWDNLGTIATLQFVQEIKHLGSTRGERVKEGILEEVEFVGKNGGVVLPIYCYEHGSIALSTKAWTGLPEGHAQFDTRIEGFIFATASDIRKWFNVKHISLKLQKTVKEVLANEVSTYGAYVNGDVYGWTLEDANGELIQSCWGYYDYEYMIEECKSQADYNIENKMSARSTREPIMAPLDYGYTLCTNEVFTELQTTELTPDTIDWVIENYLHSL